jgi:hypothetical protein
MTRTFCGARSPGLLLLLAARTDGPTLTPHSEQKVAPMRNFVWQFGQLDGANSSPQFEQKLVSIDEIAPQSKHSISWSIRMTTDDTRL